MDDVQERVANGAALLDEKIPGWELRINLQELNLSSCVTCVLGQLYGHYDEGMEEIFPAEVCECGEEHLSMERSAPHGFSASGIDTGEQYTALDVEWTRVIKERLDRGIDLGG